MEEKTAQAFAAAAGSAVLALGAMPPPLGRGSALALVGTASIVGAVFSAYRTLHVSDMPTVGPEALSEDDGTASATDRLTRTNRLRMNLLGAVRLAREKSEERARWLRVTQFFSFAAILSMIGCILVHALTGG